MLFLVMVGLSLRVYPSPGPNCPATDIALSRTFQPALAALTPGLHFGVLEAACVSGRPPGRHHDNGLNRTNLAGHSPVGFLNALN